MSEGGQSPSAIAARLLGVPERAYLRHFTLLCRCTVDEHDRWTYDPECFMSTFGVYRGRTAHSEDRTTAERG